MKLVVKIESNNGAFEDDGHGETARCLRLLAEKLDNHSDEALSGLLWDTNGNPVGSYEFTV